MPDYWTDLANQACWLWSFCEDREFLTYLDYSLIVQHLLHDKIRVVGDKFMYCYCVDINERSWKACQSGHVKYIIGDALISMKHYILERAKQKGLVVPKSWCRSKIKAGSYSTMSKILGVTSLELRYSLSSELPTKLTLMM